MTEAELSLDPATGSVSVQLHIDLLRTAGSSDAYLQLAENLDDHANEPIWSALCEGILIEQDGSRLPLAFNRADPPTPFDQREFADPFVWPRVWVFLSAQGYQAERPLTVTFKPDFFFEEPISTTITDGSRRMSRWLVTNQRSPAFEPLAAKANSDSKSNQLAPYLSTLWAGFTHILPDGWDHLLFVAAVLLSCSTLKQTALLITAFTLGHSVSLAVAGFRLVSIPASIVEPMILLSISIYALRASRIKRTPSPSAMSQAPAAPAMWPVAVIGLVHGMGFASAFGALDWSGSPLGHLFSFNLGIELAQLVFIVFAYALVRSLSIANKHRLSVLLVILPLLVLVISMSGCMAKQPNSPVSSTSGFVDSDGLRIFYERSGAGHPLILVHGWGADIQSNWIDSGWIAALSRHRTVLAIDVRGHGQSDKPYATAPYSYAAMSNDVLAVMDASGIEQADFMGYSMGSFIGAHLLGHNPERFTAMVLGGIGNETETSAAQGTVIAKALRAPDRNTIQDPMGLAVRNFVEANPSSDLEALAYSAEKMWPEGYPLKIAGEGIRNARFPVLIVNGAKDYPYVDSADYLAAELPDGRHVQLPDKDHLSAVTDPMFKTIVLEFLQGR